VIAPEWDLVVVGAGPAGAAVALTQPSDRRVLVVDRRRVPWRNLINGPFLRTLSAHTRKTGRERFQSERPVPSSSETKNS